jgi:hypothetical protein
LQPPSHAWADGVLNPEKTVTPPASSTARKAEAIKFRMMDLRASAVAGPATGERKAEG